MYDFIQIKRIDPQLRHANERVKDFDEISCVYSPKDAHSQASRCIQCGNPYCSAIGCPLENYIPQWLKYLGEEQDKMAFDISNESSPFPEILGRICPQGRLCEGACTLNDGHGAVSIGPIEVAISENGFNKGYSINYPPLIPNKSVAIVGSGPAGLSCAHFLLRAGIKPVIYEKSNKLGGLLSYGIPHFKLNKETVDRRIDLLIAGGMETHLECELGKDISLEEIYKKHDALFLGLGSIEGKVLDSKTYESETLFLAMPFLTNIQKKMYDFPYDKKYDVKNKKVIVIGGGDTAMDCVRTCIREQAKKVKCIYRRDATNMPGSTKEFISAKNEGVVFDFLKSPKNLVADSNDKIIGVAFAKNKLVENENGRDSIEEIPNSGYTEIADITILALGFDIQKCNFLTDFGVEVNSWGGIIVDENNQTTKKGVYAGGDISRGADLAVTAALDGRTAARSIIKDILK